MLLCDDTLWDYGDPETAASFAETCRSPGFETISMRDAFETIYKNRRRKDVSCLDTGGIKENCYV